MSPLNVDGSPPIHRRPDGTKCGVREGSLSLLVVELGHWSSPAFGLRPEMELAPWGLLVFRLSDTDWTDAISSLGSLACRLQVWVSPQFP